MIPKAGGGERPLGITTIWDRVVQTAAKLDSLHQVEDDGIINSLAQREAIKTTSKITALVVFAIFVNGCAVTDASPAAKNVRVISEQHAKGCRFLDSIMTHNNNTLSKEPEQDARNKALNRVAELGGNALRVTSTDTRFSPSGIGSIVTINGEAYNCK